MAMPQPVKFFCEFCGSLVRPSDKICPHCGCFVSQVRCPACQFQGEATLFYQGCPVCGFAAGKAGEQAAAASGGQRPAAKSGGPKPGYEIAYVLDDKPARSKSTIPAWVFALVVIEFLVVVGLAVFVAGLRP